MNHPRFLVFDVYGTVMDWRGSLTRDLAEIGASAGISADWPAVADAWRGRYHPTLAAVNEGRRPWATLARLEREMLDEIASDVGLGELDDAARERCVAAWNRLDPWPDVAIGLERLRERYVVATLSNGSVAMLVANAKHAGIRWDAVLSSDMVQRYKPDPAVYRLAVRLFDAHPSEVMLCAAHNSDLAAARAEGLQTAFIRRATEWGPHQRADLGPEGDVDFAARDLVDLAAQLFV